MTADEEFGPADDGLAPPMANGEVIFDSPWQGRVFGMARAMAEDGVFQWEEFRACLIAELAGVEPSAEAPFAYYDYFLRALERLLDEKGVVPEHRLGERFETFMARPHGHDHG